MNIGNIKVASGPKTAAAPSRQFWATASTEKFTATRYASTRKRAEEEAVFALQEIEGTLPDRQRLALAETVRALAEL